MTCERLSQYTTTEIHTGLIQPTSLTGSCVGIITGLYWASTSGQGSQLCGNYVRHLPFVLSKARKYKGISGTFMPHCSVS